MPWWRYILGQGIIITSEACFAGCAEKSTSKATQGALIALHYLPAETGIDCVLDLGTARPKLYAPSLQNN